MNRKLPIVLLLVPLTRLAAEETPSIERAARMRVSAPSYAAERLIGPVVSLDSDSPVGLRAENGKLRLFAIPREVMTKFEVSREPI